jgi:hypothetical protein
MFVSDEVRIRVGISAARASLADLAHAGSLFSASATAYARACAAPVRVRSRGRGVVPSRLVDVHTRDLALSDGSAGLALRWEATGPDGDMFPALDADITLTPGDADNTVLSLKGVYRRAPSTVATGQDDEELRRVATSAVRAFIDSVAEWIAGSAGNGGSREWSRVS